MLRLSVEPADAVVRIDREVLEMGGARTMIELSPGTHRLEVERSSYTPYTETIDVVRGETMDRAVVLDPYEGVLQLTVTPYASSWTLRRVEEGQSLGVVARGDEGLARVGGLLEGSYVLEVSSSGHLPEEERVVIGRDETTEMTMSLKEGRAQPLVSKLSYASSQYSIIYIISDLFINNIEKN